MKVKYQIDFILESDVDLTTTVNLVILEEKLSNALRASAHSSGFSATEIKTKVKEKIMQTFMVTAKVTTLATMKIDAYSEAQARDIAEVMDGGDFVSEENGGSWDIDTIKLLKD